MAYYVKKETIPFNPEVRIAVIVVAKKKGGVPISHLVYACQNLSFAMRSFFLCSICDSRKRNCPLNSSPFPLDSSSEIQATVPWINKVVHQIVGFIGRSSPDDGGWERVPTPRRVLRRRKKSLPLRFGDYGAILRRQRADCYAIDEEIGNLKQNYFLNGEMINLMERELAKAEARVEGLIKEMKFVRAKRLGLALSE